jgi:hypothetical protein
MIAEKEIKEAAKQFAGNEEFDNYLAFVEGAEWAVEAIKDDFFEKISKMQTLTMAATLQDLAGMMLPADMLLKIQEALYLDIIREGAIDENEKMFDEIIGAEIAKTIQFGKVKSLSQIEKKYGKKKQ